MAIQSFQIEPNTVAQATFDVHTHGYRQVTRVGVDESKQWSSPVWTDVVDDSENVAVGTTDIEGCGITVGTAQTAIP